MYARGKMLAGFAAKEYLNLIHYEGFNPLIFEATRITETSTSCIDHIHSNFVS